MFIIAIPLENFWEIVMVFQTPGVPFFIWKYLMSQAIIAIALAIAQNNYPIHQYI
jgi:hypothetical protein